MDLLGRAIKTRHPIITITHFCQHCTNRPQNRAAVATISAAEDNTIDSIAPKSVVKPESADSSSAVSVVVSEESSVVVSEESSVVVSEESSVEVLPLQPLSVQVGAYWLSGPGPQHPTT